jgi:NADH dehydrogenase/NADH:ubiquinone oxidoreductase subunit G
MGILDGIAGSVIGGGLSFLGQQGANKTNMDIAQNQMNYQTQMSNTSYQRAVKDMEAAGLNPMLAYTQGGASTPAGATTTVQNKLGEGVRAYQQQNATSSAAALQREQAKAVEPQIENTYSQTALNTANAAKSAAEAENIKAQTLNAVAQNPVILKQIEKMAAEINQLTASSKLSTATEANVVNNIAPSADPYWYRDLKRLLTPAGKEMQGTYKLFKKPLGK